MPTIAPSLTLGLPSETNYHEAFNLTVTLDNTSAPGSGEVGYGPYVDLFIPPTVENVPANANYLGLSLAPIDTYTWNATSQEWSSSPAVHPLSREDDPLESNAIPVPDGVALGLADGTQWRVYQLPFGSFTPEQPEAELTFSGAELDSTAATIRAQAGYIFGDTPTGTNGPLVGTAVSSPTQARIYALRKELDAPESETATGSNFPVTYTVTIDIDQDVTVRDLVVEDVLPADFQLLNLTFDGAQVDILQQPPTGDQSPSSTDEQADTDTDNRLRFVVKDVTGTASEDDVVVRYTVYVPETRDGSDSILNPSTGEFLNSQNTASVSPTTVNPNTGNAATASFTDFESTVGAGAFQPLTKVATPASVTLEDQSIAIQKSVRGPDSANPLVFVPGNDLTYTVNFQVSDYFNFADVIIDDVFSDGQRLDNTTVTLELSGDSLGGDNTVQITLDPSDFTEQIRTGAGQSTGGDIYNDAVRSDGSTRLQFNISQILRDKISGANNGVLNGDGLGGLRGTITYQTEVQQTFSDLADEPGFTGDASVDATDVLFSDARITGTVVNPDGTTIVGATPSDDTKTSIKVPQLPSPIKRVYAVNGVAIESGDDDDLGFSIDEEEDLQGGARKIQRVKVGDLVTYRITIADIPAPDAEDFQIIDYLPLPIYDVDDSTDGIGNGTTVSLLSALGPPSVGQVAVPGAGEFAFGPEHSLYGPGQISEGARTLEEDLTGTITAVSGEENRFTLSFGKFNNLTSESGTLDLLVTVRVEDEAFDDRLFLTNQARIVYDNTEDQPIPQDTIVRVETLQPVPVLEKTQTAAREGDDNTTAVTNPDAGDFVDFQVKVTNFGGNSIYDLRLVDTLPEGLVVDEANLAFSVERGDGTVLDITDASGTAITTAADFVSNFFRTQSDASATGVQIVDDNGNSNSLLQGGIDPGRDPFDNAVIDGTNELIIKYTLRVSDLAQGGGIYDNQAEILNFAGIEGGSNYVPENGSPSVAGGGQKSDIDDDARTTLASPTLTKEVIDTSVSEAGNDQFNQVTIGETVQYQIQVTLPEGKYDAAVIEDALPNGLEFVSLDSVTQSTGSGVTQSTGSGITPTPAPAALTAQPSAGATGTLAFTFGNIDNTDRDDNTDEVITVTYTARVRDVNASQHGRNKRNEAIFKWTSRQPTPSDQDNASIVENIARETATARDTVEIREPEVSITNTVIVQTPGDASDTDNRGDAGDDVTYTITISNASDRPIAYDALLSNQLPSTTVLNNPSLNVSVNAADWTSVGLTAPTNSDFEITAGNLLQTTGGVPTFDIPSGGTVTITVTGKVSNTVPVGSSAIDSNATVTWTSLPADNDPNERDSSSSVNPYTASANAPIEVISIPPGKTVDTTSEVSTSASNVAVGEVITYRIESQLVDGQSNNLQLRDNLPDGLQFVNGTAKFAIAATNTADFNSTFTDVNAARQTIPVSGDLSGITLTNFNDDRVSTSSTTNEDTYGSGTDIYFKFGDVTIDGLNAGDEFLIVEFKAVVLDEAAVAAYDNAGNPVSAGDEILSNTASLFANVATIDNSTTPAGTSTQADVSVVEPVLRLTQSVELNGDTFGPAEAAASNPTRPSGDGGDTASFTLDLSNVGNGPAHDLRIVQSLDPKEFDLLDSAGNVDVSKITNVVVPSGLVSATPIATLVNGLVEIAFEIDPNVDSATGFAGGVSGSVTFDVAVSDTVDANTIVVNEAFIDYADSIDGTPDVNNIQRVYADEANSNPINANNTELQILGPSVTTSLVGTSIANGSTSGSVTATNGDQVVIGEIATFNAAVSLPEGTYPGAEIVEKLDTGLRFTEVTSITVPSDFVLVTDVGTASEATVTLTEALLRDRLTPDADGHGFAIALNAGEAIRSLSGANAADEGTNDGAKSIVVQYNTIVVDENGGAGEANNVTGTQLNNDNGGDDPANLQNTQFNWNNGSAQSASSANPADPVTVIEPVLGINQRITLNSTSYGPTEEASFDGGGSPTFPEGDGGDTVSFALDVSNTGNAAAQDLRIVQVLDPTKFDILNSAGNAVDTSKFSNIVTPAGFGAPTFALVGGQVEVQFEFTGAGGLGNTTSGGAQTVSFDVAIADTANAGEIVVNEAFIDYADSIAGDPDSSTGSVQRVYVNADDGDTSNDLPANQTRLQIPGPTVTTELLSTEFDNGSTSGSVTATNGDQVVIGERANFGVSIALPEGTFPDARIVESLDSGLEFRRITGFTAPDDLVLVSNVGTNSESSVLLSSLSLTDIQNLVTPDGDGHGFTFALGANQAIRNLDTNNDGNQTFSLQYETVVVDEAANTTGTQLNNDDSGAPQNTQFQWNNGSVQTETATNPADPVTVIQPVLGLNQSLTVNSQSYGPTEEASFDAGGNPTIPGADGGDTVAFQLDVSNSGNAAAQDLRIVQVLDPNEFDLLNAGGTAVDPSKVTGISVPTGFNSTPTFNLLPSGLVEIEFEYTATDGFSPTSSGPEAIQFSAVLRDIVQAGDIIVNEAFIDYADSIDGTPPSGVQRVYVNADDGDTGNDLNANETRLQILRPDISTRLVGTEFANGSTAGVDPSVVNGDRAVIGEKVSFEISALLPEESFPKAEIVEKFDDGLGFVEITGFEAGDDLVIVTPGQPNQKISDLTLTQFRALVTPDADGRGFTFAIADNQSIRNLSFPNNDGSQVLRIQYDTVVLNEVGNQGGVELNNDDEGAQRSRLNWELNGNPTFIEAAAPADSATVVEPTLTLDQSVIVRTPGVPTDNDTNGRPGDLVTYTIVIDGTSSDVDAFDIDLTTLFPAQFVPDPTTPIQVDSAGTTVAGVTVGDFQLTTNGSGQPQLGLQTPGGIDVPAGQRITLTINGTVSNAAVSGDGLASNSDLRWSSLDGSVTNVSNDDGFSSDTERTGADGAGGVLNDYAATDNAPITIDGITPTIIKSIPTTSEPATQNPTDSTTAPTPGAIGEVVTYRLAVKLSEGITTDVVVTDVVPDGLQLVPNSARLVTTLDGTTFDGSVVAAGDTPGVDAGIDNGDLLMFNTSAVTGGQQLEFSFGGTQITGDNDPDDDTFYIEYQAIVQNVAGNQDGASPTNLKAPASLVFDDVNGNPVPAIASNEPELLVTEPLLTIETRVLDRFDVAQDADDTGIGDPSPPVSVTQGDRVTVEIEIAAPSGDDFDGPAFEVALTNALPAGLTFDGNLALVSGPSPTTLTYDSVGNEITGAFDLIRDGETVVIRYNAIVSGNTTITDTASITYTSLPNTDPEERTGTDGVGSGLNNFAATDPANILVNTPPDTDDAIYNNITPNTTIPLDADGVAPVAGDRLGGSDPDTGDSVQVYIINTLPPSDQGRLLFDDDNNPTTPGVPVTVGQEIQPGDLNRLEFEAASGFTGTEFTYVARDTFGATDPTPATVFLTPGSNLPPDTESVTRLVKPGETIPPLPLPVPTGEDPYGSDPDGTVEGFRIVSLPGYGILSPNRITKSRGTV